MALKKLFPHSTDVLKEMMLNGEKESKGRRKGKKEKCEETKEEIET